MSQSSSQPSKDCPGRLCFELLGRKWTTGIVWALLPGPRRFSALHNALPGLSDKVLSRRLSELERAGIVSRAYHREIPPRVEYTLTAAGLALRQVITEMERWSREYPPNLRTGSNGSGRARSMASDSDPTRRRGMC